mgnify:CR=1 FL=1
MALKDQRIPKRIMLEVNPGFFNKIILKIDELDRKDFLEDYVEGLLNLASFKKQLKWAKCPCSYIIYKHKPKLVDSKILIDKEIYYEQIIKENELRQALIKIENQNNLQEQRLAISKDLHDNIGSQLTFIISSLDNLKYFEFTKDKLYSKNTIKKSFLFIAVSFL